jgi:hypothetical protein
MRIQYPLSIANCQFRHPVFSYRLMTIDSGPLPFLHQILRPELPDLVSLWVGPAFFGGYKCTMRQ